MHAVGTILKLFCMMAALGYGIRLVVATLNREAVEKRIEYGLWVLIFLALSR